MQKNNEWVPYKVCIKMRIQNGLGDPVRNSIKRGVPKQLVTSGKGAIKIVGDWSENMPNNGWTSFDWYGTIHLKINIKKILEQNAGKFMGGMISRILTFTGCNKWVISDKVRD